MSAEDVGRSISVQGNTLEPTGTKNKKDQFLRKFTKVENRVCTREELTSIL